MDPNHFNIDGSFFILKQLPSVGCIFIELCNMDARTREEETGFLRVKPPGVEKNDSGSKLKGKGSLSSSEMMVRADTIDLKNLDMQLDQRLNTLWSKTADARRPKEEWEIDLSKLELKHCVARGTYGSVYRGTYGDQDVAVILCAYDHFTDYMELLNSVLKLLDWGEEGMATAADAASVRAAFQQEVAVWQKLDHRNVTKFVGASMGTSNLKIPQKNSANGANNSLSPRVCCVIVEYIPGGTLKQFLIRNRRKKLPFKDVVQLALDLARGLSYLHSKKIVHRDVKTENMLLDYERTVKIADFGVARVEAQNPRDMTGSTGTYGYMAPEVLDGKPYDHKCDVYSYGICLWEMYCCAMPYAEFSFSEVSSAIVARVSHLK
ncbi:hypothetical protein KSS87_017135, partial [Heliosperma pusillum]